MMYGIILIIGAMAQGWPSSSWLAARRQARATIEEPKRPATNRGKLMLLVDLLRRNAHGAALVARAQPRLRRPSLLRARERA